MVTRANIPAFRRLGVRDPPLDWVQPQLPGTASNTDYRDWLWMLRRAVCAATFKTSLYCYVLNHLK